MSRTKEKFGLVLIFMGYGYTFLIMLIVYVYRSFIEYFVTISGICATIFFISILIFMITYEIKLKKERENDKKQEILRLANSLTEKEESIKFGMDAGTIVKYLLLKRTQFEKMFEKEENLLKFYLKPDEYNGTT